MLSQDDVKRGDETLSSLDKANVLVLAMSRLWRLVMTETLIPSSPR